MFLVGVLLLLLLLFLSSKCYFFISQIYNAIYTTFLNKRIMKLMNYYVTLLLN